MTLFFNLEKLQHLDTAQFLNTLRTYANKDGVLSVRDRNWIPGNSFLLNPSPLFTLKHIDPAYIVQYVKLAGRRDYSLYKHYGVKSLQLSYYPDISLDIIKTNTLLNITKTEIKFFYEENIRKN